MKLFGVIVKCAKGCWHLVSAEKDYFDAWARAFPTGGLDSATTIRIGANAKAVRALKARA